MIADLAMQKALDRYHRGGIAGLSEDEKTLAAIWYFESRVSNGGFDRFFRSKEGELAALAPAAFHRIGAATHADLAQRANDVFGPGGVPAEKALRIQFLDAASGEVKRTFDELEARYFESVGDLDEKIEAYLTQRRARGDSVTPPR